MSPATPGVSPAPAQLSKCRFICSNCRAVNQAEERPEVGRFTNEDHLAVHKHKHEMTLKFGPARTDSTPTPTRFLKNCEEVGLFNELASSFEHDVHFGVCPPFLPGWSRTSAVN
uniref:Uncharacterized protein n=1 Tax=Cyanistes caeruleus TaxID=156563 RepID=A0A8C0V5L5_CYACU